MEESLEWRRPDSLLRSEANVDWCEGDCGRSAAAAGLSSAGAGVDGASAAGFGLESMKWRKCGTLPSQRR